MTITYSHFRGDTPFFWPPYNQYEGDKEGGGKGGLLFSFSGVGKGRGSWEGEERGRNFDFFFTSSIMNEGQQDHFRQNDTLLLLRFMIRYVDSRKVVIFLCLHSWTLHLAALYALEINSIRNMYSLGREYRENIQRKTVPPIVRLATTCTSGHGCHIRHKRPARCSLFALTQTVQEK